MGDLTSDSSRLIEEGRRLRDDNRAGGRHRRPIGRESAALRSQFRAGKLKRLAMALGAILLGAAAIGLAIDGLGFVGLFATLIAVVVATLVLTRYPKMKVPRRADLDKGSVRDMVGKTELWLEHQRPALPPPAAKIVNDMGVQLDALGLQLETIDQTHPAAREVRSLVGEILPETIDAYRRIPAQLRHEERAGSTPDRQLTESLGKISREIDQVTRKLAEGSLDDLAIRSKYLDYKYGEPDRLEDHS